MPSPHIEISQISADTWQAVVAWNIQIPSHKDWLSSRWGFNAGALLDEALDRLKLFVKSFHTIDILNQTEPQSTKTLALRCINIPDTGLQLGLIGKMLLSNSIDVSSTAIIFCREVESIFPHDFIITRATSKEHFLQFTGDYIFNSNNTQPDVLHIKRADVIAKTLNGSSFLTGFWQTSNRSSEQIWRALAAMPNIVALNITLRPTLIFESELRLLWEIKNELENAKNDTEKFDRFDLLIPWLKNYLNRRLSPWNKFYYMQVHIISKEKADASLGNSIGAAITYDGSQLIPGFVIESPGSIRESQMWLKHLYDLEIIPSATRLHDIADVEEAYSTFRFPYLSETGLPNVKFLSQTDL